MANTTEPPSWASIADEFSRFSERYPLGKGQLPLSIHYLAIGFDHGDRTSRWSVENGSGESARREFQDMAAHAWRQLCGVDHPHAWMRWCDVLLAEAAKDEVHETMVSGTSYPERLPTIYLFFDLPDACRISGRIARKLRDGSAVWQWPSEERPEIAADVTTALQPTTLVGAAEVEQPVNVAPEPSLEVVDLQPPIHDAPLGDYVFRYVEMRWEMRFAGRTAFVPQAKKGFELIRALLETPNAPRNVLTLMGPEAPSSDTDIDETEIPIATEMAGVETADPETRKQCLHEIAQFKQDREEALRRDDQEGADWYTGEIERVERYLSSRFNHHGQPRITGKHLKRAQEAVQKQFTRALLDIEARHPDLAAYLLQTVKTGYTCVYDEPNANIQWMTR